MKYSIFTLSLPALALANNLVHQVGHHVIYSYPGLEPPPHLFDLINQGKVGGIILFGENVHQSLSTTVQKFQATYTQSQGYNGTPLLIMTDQEGGDIRRLPGGPEQTAKEVGKSSKPKEAAAQTGIDAAAALDAYHVNTNLGPILGVYREENDFLDHYQRSYGNTSHLVSLCATAFIQAQQSSGVIATAKHFPGLGLAKTEENTDERPVTISAAFDTLRTIDEAPYHQAIAAGVDMIMPSWAVYPALDSKPAGLSAAWIRELRNGLGFKGATISDAIEAGALKDFGDDSNRAVLAAQAGMDIILASGRNVTQGESIVDALVNALQSGKLDKQTFQEGTGRILNVRQKV